jgi:hypothetical protein
MRALRLLVAALMLLPLAVTAEPRSGPGYRLETVIVPGAVLAGLARDGDDLLFTDLGGGRLYRRHRDGTLTAFGPVFPHGLDVIGDPTGPYRVLPADDAYVVAQGWTPAGAEEGTYDHALVMVDGDEARVVDSDFWNPYDFVASGGAYYVVDAARNTVERLEPGGTGRKTLVAFDRISQAGLQDLSPTEFPKGTSYEVDAVPTGIALHEGRLYVSLFGGFPFVAGGGKVVSLPENGDAPALRIERDGLNAPVDIAFDTKGRLLVLEHGRFDQATGFQAGSGRLLRFEMFSGEPEVLLEGLTRPVSVLVWDDRQIIVSELGDRLHFLTSEP